MRALRYLGFVGEGEDTAGPGEMYPGQQPPPVDDGSGSLVSVSQLQQETKSAMFNDLQPPSGPAFNAGPAYQPLSQQEEAFFNADPNTVVFMANAGGLAASGNVGTGGGSVTLTPGSASSTTAQASPASMLLHPVFASLPQLTWGWALVIAAVAGLWWWKENQ